MKILLYKIITLSYILPVCDIEIKQSAVYINLKT